MYLSAIDKVEYLHHDKYIEHKCHVSRVNTCFVESSLVISSTTDLYQSTRTNSAPYYSVVPLPLGIGYELGAVERIQTFRNE